MSLVKVFVLATMVDSCVEALAPRMKAELTRILQLHLRLGLSNHPVRRRVVLLPRGLRSECCRMHSSL